MSYTPTNWATGDVITAEKLNNMESGIVRGQELFVIHATNVATDPTTVTNPVLDKTYAEIANAIQAGKIPVLIADISIPEATSIGVLPFTSFAGNPNNMITFGSVRLTYDGSSYSLANVNVSVQLIDGVTECESTIDVVEIPSK